MSISFIANIVGLVGVVTVLTAYTLLQLQRLDPYGFAYSFMNLAASMMVLFSLYYEWNLPSFIIEVVWSVISIYGLYRAVYRAQKRPAS